MSIAFVRRGWILFVTTPNAVLLSVCIRVRGCLCPISFNSCLIATASHVLMYNAPSSASSALDMTDLMIWDMFSTSPLLGGLSTFADMKKCPPALLWAPGLLKYEASLCTASTMSLFYMLGWRPGVLQRSLVAS